jgi:hypothetical protein
MITRLLDDRRRRSETELLDKGWSMTELRPELLTGLPMAVRITENDGYRDDVRVKVSTVHGGGGSWHGAPSMAVGPQPRLVHRGRLPTWRLSVAGSS